MPKFKELLRVAIVEDDDSYAETLQEYLNKYEQENEVRFQVVRYEDGETWWKSIMGILTS